METYRHQSIVNKVGEAPELISDRPDVTDSTVYRVRRGTRDWLLKVFDHLHDKSIGRFPQLGEPGIRHVIGKVLTRYRQDSVRIRKHFEDGMHGTVFTGPDGVAWNILPKVIPHGMATDLIDPTYLVTKSPRFISGATLKEMRLGLALPPLGITKELLFHLANVTLPELSSEISGLLGRPFTIKPANVKLGVDPQSHAVTLKITDISHSIFESYQDMFEEAAHVNILPISS